MAKDIINISADKAIKDLERLNQTISKGGAELLQYIENAKKLGDTLQSAKGLKEYAKASRDLDVETAKIKKTTSSINKTYQDRINLEKKLVIAQSEAGKQNEILRQQILKTNKENREAAKASIEGERAYKKLSKALTNVRDEAKDVGAEMLELRQRGKENTDEYRKLQARWVELSKQTKILDDGIKEIDSSLGQHQRNVGNYRDGLTDTIPILGNVDNRLRAMGTSLDQLAASKNPFAPLVTGLKGLGKAALTFAISPIGLLITTVGGLFALIRGNKDTVVEFDKNLRSVGKTANLQGQELRNLGQEVVGLSNELKVIDTSSLLEIATVAGQLGIEGSENILKFSETLAKLETASDVTGEEGASNIARFLTLTDRGVQNVKAFGDELTILGNNFAATENEILGNATAIAQNTSQYELGRQASLAYATATKALGIEAEITGSTLGRTLGLFEKAIRTGEGVENITRLTGMSLEELRKQFKENADVVLNEFVRGLNETSNAGGSVNAELEALGINAVRDQRVISSLATSGFDTLTSAIDKTKEASGALNEEFGRAALSLENQWKRFGIAWDNIVLSIEDGQGVFSKAGAVIVNIFATAMEMAVELINEINKNFKELSFELSLLTGNFDKASDKGFEFQDVLKLIAFSITNGIRMFRDLIGVITGFVRFLNNVNTGIRGLGKEIAVQFANIQNIINRFDITRPFKSLKQAINDLRKLSFGDTIKKEFDKVSTSNAQQKAIQATKELQESLKGLTAETPDAPETPNAPEAADYTPMIEAKQKAADKMVDIEMQRLKDEADLMGKELKLFQSINKGKLEDKEATSLLELEVLKRAINREFIMRSDLAAKEYQLKKKELEDKGASVTEMEALEVEYTEKLLSMKAETAERIKEINQSITEANAEHLEIQIEQQRAFIEGQMEREQERREAKVEGERETAAAVGAILGKERETVRAFELFKQARNAETAQAKEQLTSQAAGAVANILGRETVAGKTAAAFQAVINTKLAITKVLSQGGIFAPPLAAAIGAIGFLQVRQILAKQPPKFEKGTLNAPEGWAITQEKGAEIITDKQGNIKTLGHQKGDSLTYLEKGDKVYPANVSKMIMEGAKTPNIPPINLDVEKIDYGKIEKGFKNALGSKPTETVVLENGIPYLYYVKNGSTRKRRITPMTDNHKFKGLR